MNKQQQLSERHTLPKRIIFKLKINLLVLHRTLKNLFSPVHTFKDEKKLINEPVISISVSELWNSGDNRDNWILTAGKVENLRIAVRKLHGMEVKAGQIFSFWKQIGNPNYGKGYVMGREIREGCIVPTIAGGLCQLSNALYDAALKANFEIIERHRHTQVIQGSLAEKNRDATVKWNYIDLRFRSTADFRIEATLSSSQLIVHFKSSEINSPAPETKTIPEAIAKKINDCYSCGNLACSKHLPPEKKKEKAAVTTFILDEKWPEFDKYICSVSENEDHFIVPIRNTPWLRSDRYQWSSLRKGNTSSTSIQGIYRALLLRYAARSKRNVFELGLKSDKKIARAAIKKIPVHSTHIVVAQNLLPFLFETGILGGRSYDVLMTRMPFGNIHQQLNDAHQQYPESTTLNDFRAPELIVTTEKTALHHANKVITPHSAVAALFNTRAEKLKWVIPDSSSQPVTGKKILFPASAVGRKGAYEMKQLAQELSLDLVISGRALEKPGFWEDVHTELFNGDFESIGLVVYPVHVEHQPRQVLKAIARGIPVITTSVCGLPEMPNVIITEPGNMNQLINEVQQQLRFINNTVQL